MERIIDYKFNAYGKEYDFRLNTRELNRNYDDEDYCYWIKESDGHYFEINIYKDEQGELTNNGCVFAAIDLAAFEDMDYTQIDDVTITFK